jgi:hypothetical protein
MAAREGHVEVLEKLWDLAKELQLKPEELRNEMLVSKNNFDQTVWHIKQEKATLKYLRNGGIGLKNCN